MTPRPSIDRARLLRPSSLLAAAFFALLLFATIGCQKHAGHTADPQLRKIDDMIAAQIPAGSTVGHVHHFLSSRGFPVEDSHDRRAIVAVVRQVDTDTLQPVTARVTFHFDENDKLISYNLIPAMDVPLNP
jgi:hypothetical protein